MKVLFNNFPREYNSIKSRIYTAIERVLNSGQFILGEELDTFEQSFARYCGAKFCLGVGSGTDALMLSLKALGIGCGDFVITVSNTAVPTASAISMAGAEPVFIDIDEETFLMDPDMLEKRLKKLPKKIRKNLKAVIPVHLYGAPCFMSHIKETTNRFGLKLIEDCAQSHGATFQGKKVGTIGDIGCFSFYPTKNLSCYGDGGAIVTDSKEIYQKIKKLRNHGQKDRYYHTIKGTTSRLDEMQAAILRLKLLFVEKWNKRRIQNQKRYRQELRNLPIRFQEVISGGKHVYHLLIIRLRKRDALQRHLFKNGVQTLIHYPIPIHLQRSYRYLGYKKGDLPVTERAAGEVLSLPVSPFLKAEEIDFVIQKIKEFFI